MVRSLSRRMLLAALLAAFPAATWTAAATITHDCASPSTGGGWQTPGASPASGESACGEGQSFILLAAHDAYWQSMRPAPDFSEVTVETEVFLGEIDGSPDDAFSLLLHWSGSTDPTACCEPVHAASGLRILFSLARNRMEVYQETGGVTTGPLATLPFSLPVETFRRIRVGYSGTLLDLTVDGTPVGSVTVPATPPAPFGFDARHVSMQFAPFILTVGCSGDADCDGIADGIDNCPTTAGADQTDTDHDGLGNLCDTDDDGDGVPDTGDRCPLIADPLQEDSDGDLVGDACDPCRTDPSNDVDGDRICGQSDNCPGVTNPGQENADSDTEGDACDLDDGSIFVQWVDPGTLTWQREFPFTTFNVYRRNLAELRATGQYVVDPASGPGPLNQRTCDVPDNQSFNEPLGLGEAVAYFFSGSLFGAEGSLGTDSDGVQRPNDYPCGDGFLIPFEVVLHGWDGPKVEQTLLIDNLTDWCAFRPSACGAPGIDFSTHVALVVADGSKPDGCHDIRVTRIRTGASATDVEIEYESLRYVPLPPCGCTLAFVEPFEVVKVPRPVTSADFTEIPRTITLPCH